METNVEWNAHESEGAKAQDEQVHEEENNFRWHPEEPVGVWQGGEGKVNMLLGVALPALAISCTAALNVEPLWHLALLRPLETLVESGLVLSIPLGNYFLWSGITNKDSRFPVRNGLLSGLGIGTSLFASAFTLVALAMGYPVVDHLGVAHGLTYSLLGAISGVSAIIGICLVDRARKLKETTMARVRTIGYAVAGIMIALLGIAGSEARLTLIRIAETMAVSDNLSDQAKGISLLRDLEPEKDIRMNCADSAPSGMAGVFLRLPNGALQQLYFAATGKPFRDQKNTNMALMSNDYLRRHVVGSPIEGLSLVRSAIHGTVHADTMSASMDWTFVFKNKTYQEQEARAEIALPAGTLLSGMTLWINGEPKKAVFASTYNKPEEVDARTSHQMPALITDLGRGRYLLQCSPVPSQGEVKVAVTITQALKIDGPEELSLALPRFIDNNFSLSGQHTLSLRAPNKAKLSLNGRESTITADGDGLLVAKLKDDELNGSSFAIRVHDSNRRATIAVEDPLHKGEYIVQQVNEVSAVSPRRLVVVVDGSKSVSQHLVGIKNALAKLPSGIETKLLIANDDSEPKMLSFQDGLKKLETSSFKGGRDNLEALVKAAEFAGESSGGAVLWVHGPQPGFNNEMYIMAPYAAAPRFLELALDDCWTDANELFRNHKEIGPFTPIVRNANVQDDLQHFFQRWQAGAKELTVKWARTTKVPTCAIAQGPQAQELSVLESGYQCANLLLKNRVTEAARIAVANNLVTPVSGAVVMTNSSGGAFGIQSGSSPAVANASATDAFEDHVAVATAPTLQGATNGAIGPQGGDSTVIQGINTAGTVRVNNLANLEALLNLFANSSEILGLAIGLVNLILGALGRSSGGLFKMSARTRMVAGVGLMVLGLAIPGVLNWLLASARDSNLFS
ncbi:MAG: hypothetical protein K2W95_30250 [Candidatus Obscuribacterales bacterium]|nr:hypothetical protein [Candidatus Obscuribacterales bacterium]